MRISVARAKHDHETRFLGELSRTCRDLGHDVIVSYRPKGDLHIQWGARPHRKRHTLYAELGWLPRWHYQLSHAGINHAHHQQGEGLPTLTAAQRLSARRALDDIRNMVGAPNGWQHASTTGPAACAPKRFVLAPLQMENDTNMDSVPPELRTNQGFVDHVTDHVDSTLGSTRIVFKQHPNSKAQSQLSLSMRRKGDKVYPHRQAPVHAYLKHPGCVAVVSLNSNVLNDSLLWNIPAMAMGGGIWPDDLFLNTLDDIDLWPLGEQYVESYAYWLSQVQWSIGGARNPERVSESIEGAMG